MLPRVAYEVSFPEDTFHTERLSPTVRDRNKDERNMEGGREGERRYRDRAKEDESSSVIAREGVVTKEDDKGRVRERNSKRDNKRDRDMHSEKHGEKVRDLVQGDRCMGTGVPLQIPVSQAVGSKSVNFSSYSFEWMNGYTMFCWAWWVTWAPAIGVFIAHISRGRSIRQVHVSSRMPTYADVL